MRMLQVYHATSVSCHRCILLQNTDVSCFKYVYDVTGNMKKLFAKMPVIYVYHRVSCCKCIMLQDATGKELQWAIPTKQ